MAVTFIDYQKDKGFWIVEDAMELAFQYIFKELKIEGKYSFSKHDDLLYDAKANTSGWRRGYLGLSWDEDLDGVDDEQEMIRLLENILVELRRKGTYISVEEIQAFPSEAEDWKSFWDIPFPTQNLIQIFEALVKMLKVEWTSTNYNMEIDFNR
jgi:hypothetical protein